MGETNREGDAASDDALAKVREKASEAFGAVKGLPVTMATL